MDAVKKIVKARENYKSHIAQITEGKKYEVIKTNIFGDYLIIDDKKAASYCFSYKFSDVK